VTDAFGAMLYSAVVALALSVLLAGAPSGESIAADSAPVIRQQERLLREHEQQLDRLERRHEAPRRQPPAQQKDEESLLEPLPPSAACLPIKTIHLEGVSAVSETTFSDILSAYTNRCLGLSDIDDLTRALTNRYVELGYVTARVYVPPQDASGGELRITVIEGKVEELRLEDGGGLGARLATAFPGIRGNVLNLRDLEQGLDQMNRLRSNDARLRLEPGRQTGGTIVHIDNKPSKRLSVEAGWDNLGSHSTGERVGSLSVDGSDLLRLNDLWTVDYRRSLADTRTSRSSESISAFLSIPYGYWTGTVSSSWFRYRSVIRGLSQAYSSSGISRSWKTSVERVLHRDADGKTAASLALSVKDTINYIEGLRLDTSSRRLSVLEAALHHDRRLWGGVLSASVTRTDGLPSLGAQSDHARTPDAPEAKFEKWDARLSYARPLPLSFMNLAWQVEAAGQWSEDTLFGTERIGIGGLYTVRGVKEESLSGDIGGYVRSGLRWTLPALGHAVFDHAVGRLALGVAYDVGSLRQDDDEYFEHGTLRGVALTLASNGKAISANLTWARALQAPDHFEAHGDVVYAALSLRY